MANNLNCRVDEQLSRRAHIPESVGATPTPAPTKKPLMFLTSKRRARIAEIMRYNNVDTASITQKANFVKRHLGEPCSFNEALSLLAQFRRCRKRRMLSGQSVAEINHERFERMMASRSDLY